MVKSSKRDPERPKKYMSAFLLFLGEFRKANSCRGYSTTEMTQKGASVWRSLSSREKAPYEEKSLKLKEKYTREFNKYKEKVKACKGKQSLAEQPSTSKKVKRDPNRPKKPLSAYMLFMQDFRKRNSNRNWDVREMVTNGALAWKTLSGAERQPYERMARKNSTKFHKKLGEYKKKQKKLQIKQQTTRKPSTSTRSGSKPSASTRSGNKPQPGKRNKAKLPNRTVSTKRRTTTAKRRPVKGGKGRSTGKSQRR